MATWALMEKQVSKAREVHQEHQDPVLLVNRVQKEIWERTVRTEPKVLKELRVKQEILDPLDLPDLRFV